jgi:hypothetical protein
MPYELMLLAEPGELGPSREEVLRVLGEDPQVTVDETLSSRHWLALSGCRAQVNLGSKETVESVHVEIEGDGVQERDEAVDWALVTGARLEMRLEDVLWGHEVTAENRAALREWWAQDTSPQPQVPAPRRQWWKLW